MFGEPELRQGDQGDDVRLLQASLKEHFQLFGEPLVDPGEIDGDFGSGTRQAVEALQSSVIFLGQVDGVVGAITWTWLDSLDFRFPASDDLSHGETGNRVRHLQRLLYTVDENPGKIDGIYGSSTETAVRRFQGSQGLSENGRASGETRSRLRGVFA